MFTTNHFIWLGICAVLITILLFIALKKKFSVKRASYIMAIVALVSEISKILTHMIDSDTKGMVIDPKALPLHLCSILIFVIFYIAFFQNGKHKDKLISFVVPIGIIGGTLAILIATSGVSFKDPEVYQCFIYHAILVWYALYLISLNGSLLLNFSKIQVFSAYFVVDCSKTSFIVLKAVASYTLLFFLFLLSCSFFIDS